MGVRAERGDRRFAFFWGREGWVPGRWRQRPGMDWPSGLGGVGRRGRFSWVDGSELKILRFFGAGSGGAWSGATEEDQG